MPIMALHYTWRGIVIPFLGGVIFFTFVFLMFQAVRLADYFINHGVEHEEHERKKYDSPQKGDDDLAPGVEQRPNRHYA